MAYRGDEGDPAGDFGPIATQPTASTGVNFKLLGQDPQGKNVYQGSDGRMYTDDPTGPNGFGPYSGPGLDTDGTQTTEAPTGPAPTGPAPTGPAPTGVPIAGGPFDYTPAPAPGFNPPAYTPPPAFSYGDFVAPTGESIWNDSGVDLRRKMGEQALLNNRASRGVVNTGGAIKDFIAFNQNFAGQEYGNAWSRAAEAYKMNRGNALENYNTNYGTQFKDPYNFNYAAAQDQFNPQFTAWQTGQQAQAHGLDQSNYYNWMLANA